MKRTLLLTGIVVGLLSTSGIARATILCPLPGPTAFNSFTAGEQCSAKAYGPCTFVKQKPDGNCLYDCPYTDTCVAETCSPPSCTCSATPTQNSGVDRIKKAYPMGQCPSANLFNPASGDPVPPGTE